MAVRQQVVSMVARGGVGVTLVDAKGNPYATTGDGALVFNRNPILIDPVFEGTSTIERVALGLGTEQLPAVQLGPLDTGLYAPADDTLAVVLNGNTTVQFNPDGVAIVGNLSYSGELSGAYHSPLTTDGDIYAFIAGEPARLPRGAPGDFLQSSAAGLQWVSLAGTGTVTQVNTIPNELTGGPITTSGTLGLADTLVSPGVYGNSTNVASFNVDQKGRITSAGSVPVDVTLALGYVPVNKAGDTMTGPLNGTSSNWTGRLTVTVADAAQAALFRGATKGVRFVPAAGEFAIEGVDQTGSASYQPIRLSGSEVRFGAAAETMRLTTVGLHVGNAPLDPLTKLHVQGLGQVNANFDPATGQGATILVKDTGAAVGNGGALMFANFHGNFAALKSYVITGTGPLGDLVFSLRRAGADATFTEALRIQSSGQVTLGGTNNNFPGINRFGATSGIIFRAADATGGYTLISHGATSETLTLSNATDTAIIQIDSAGAMFVRPQKAGSSLFLGGGAANAAFVQSTGIYPVTHLSQVLGNASFTFANTWTANATINNLVGTVRSVQYATNGVVRFAAGISGSAESGGNAGSDYFINRHNDAGTFIDTPFQINRATGQITQLVTRVSRLGVLMDPGSVTATAVGWFNGDITLNGANKSVMGNLYYDSGWKYTANGTGAATLYALDTTTPYRIMVAPNNAGGAGAAAAPTTALQASVAGIIDTPVGSTTLAPAAADNSTRVPTTAWVQALLATLGLGIPAGTVAAFAGSAAPTGWYLCDGSSKTVAGDSALHTAIGYTYGGSGANFNVPDLRGRFLAGLDGGTGRLTGFTVLGTVGGDQNLQAHTHGPGSLQTADHLHTPGSLLAPAHGHLFDAGNTTPASVTHRTGQGDGISAYQQSTYGAGPWGLTGATGAADRALTLSGASASTGAGAAQNVPPVMAMNVIIKR